MGVTELDSTEVDMPSSRSGYEWRPNTDHGRTVYPEHWHRAGGPMNAGDWVIALVLVLWTANHPGGEPFPEDLADLAAERGVKMAA